MKKIAMVPARYAATRFPGKLMQLLNGKAVIRHTYDNTVATNLFDDVFVVTDSRIIYDEIAGNGGKAIMSQREHESGSDRIAEAADGLETDIIVNVQGDEPFVNAKALANLLQVFEGPTGLSVQVASLMQVLTDEKSIADPNYVKVAVALNDDALFFSRSPLPYHRDKALAPLYYEHIGVYAFRKQSLMDFSRWGPSPLEALEKVECLRYVEHGVPIRMVRTEYMGVEIDTPEDLSKAEKFLKDH